MKTLNINVTLVASLSAILLLTTSCEKTITPEIDGVEAQIVIDGLITDLESHNYVKLGNTVDFYSGEPSPVTDATVSVEDNEGNITTFLPYTGSSADSIGMYFPEGSFAGVVGKTYKLTVVAGGKTYTAEDEMLRLVPMDKIDYRVSESEAEDPEDPGRIYELLLWVTEPRETRDYYLFKGVRNGKVEYENPTDVYFSDDELISENLDGIPMPLYYAKGDRAGVEVYSLTRSGFIFYRDLQKLLTNDGGLFGTPPANPRTNLSDGAVGFFQVSAIRTGELLIE
jgi:hypothetical protein